ncbi:MAG: gfo/Idh/MocA family oxidoreductase [Acidobacteria bacterium]|nr:MAG: gfo/Idh/MocA family oxidoreductase [Acidobacteriota bacterium]
MATSLSAGAALWAAPAIVPATVLGANGPGNRIQIGVIGVGRIARDHDMPGVWKHDLARIIAVSDLDSKRLADGKKYVEAFYAKRTGQASHDVAMYGDYREMLSKPEIDAVVICTPDHWHAKPAIEAALAGKDIYLEKPTSLTIAEGRAMSDAIHRTGRILQIGTQQRSAAQFRVACELVRNGRIGELKTVQVGLPVDPSGQVEPEMPVPPNLNYEMWLGSTPWVYYTEKRVHPQNDYSRPGWLRCEQFGAGMITGWGVHHMDIAHWGMNMEYSGPVEIEGTAEFPKSGLWDVHGPYKIQAKYANGVTVFISDSYPNGIRFEGTAGWIFVTRGSYAATSSDPVPAGRAQEALTASDPKILTPIGPNEIHLYESADHHGNWLESVKARKQPICPVEVGHRSCSVCLVGHIAMKLNRKLYWDPAREHFKNDDQANSMLSRAQRWPWGVVES